MRKFKWELLVIVIGVVLTIMSIKSHINLNGYYEGVRLEGLMGVMFTAGFYYIVKDIRTNPENWRFPTDKDELDD